ncbi:MAG: hypothetical protein AAF513_18365 [Pseudomonadota bacterium]
MSQLLPWLEPVYERVLRLRDDNRLPNAVALTAARGWGEERLLGALAKALLNIDDERHPAEIAHPDLRWLVPEGSVIKIDQVRALNEFAVRTAQGNGVKVAAICDAHLLNENAANGLLKTLEEPPAATHILLATCHWGRLLPTVRSRCTRLAIRADTTAGLEWLATQGVQLDAQTFTEYGAAPLTALQAEHHADLLEWLALVGRDSVAAVEQAQALDDVSAWLERWYRRLNQHLQGRALPGLQAAPREIFRFVDELIDIKRQLDTTNATNVRLALERLTYGWQRLHSR